MLFPYKTTLSIFEQVQTVLNTFHFKPKCTYTLLDIEPLTSFQFAYSQFTILPHSASNKQETYLQISLSIDLVTLFVYQFREYAHQIHHKKDNFTSLIQSLNFIIQLLAPFIQYTHPYILSAYLYTLLDILHRNPVDSLQFLTLDTPYSPYFTPHHINTFKSDIAPSLHDISLIPF